MRKRAAIAGALVLAGAALWLATRQPEPSGTTLTLYGNVELRDVDLAFRRSGRVAAVHVEEGESVAPATLIASLDAEPFQEAVTTAEARVRTARAALDRLEHGSRPQEVRRAKAVVAEGEARLAQARWEFERMARLEAEGVATEQEHLRAQEAHAAAMARLEQGQEELALVIEGPRGEDIAAGRAELELAEAQLAEARTALEDTELRTPSRGTVITRAREPGAMVAAGETVTTLYLPEPVVVRAYVAEPLLAIVRPGTEVMITTDSSARTYRGRVGFVSPQAEFTPKTVETPELRTDLVYRLRIVVKDPDDGLLQGMPVTVSVSRTQGQRPAPGRT